ncbi:MAG: DUF92 domain-containing protein [Candidatus Eremiobacteraeota bacterium]|nr:DUF92 domain-containing protein [Candidatus Eremiobacteraeota bacterium]
MRAERNTQLIDRLTLAPLTNFDLGGFFAVVAALAAFRFGVLTGAGAFVAFVVGTCVYGSGGLPDALVLFAFFIPAIAISGIGRARKGRLNVDIGKLGARDAGQVFANGGAAAICALFALSTYTPWHAAFAGALAAAAADTWGTELGTLTSQRPRSILTGRFVAAGLSGGITVSGTLAELLGAAFIASTAALLHVGPWFAIFAGGVAGALVDSLLGASAQALRFCAACQRACENEPHSCGANTALIRGAAWMSNDAVNFLATVSGATVAALLFSR